jgi:hypothetical protein
VLLEHEPSWNSFSKVIQLGFSYLKRGFKAGAGDIAIAPLIPTWCNQFCNLARSLEKLPQGAVSGSTGLHPCWRCRQGLVARESGFYKILISREKGIDYLLQSEVITSMI